VAGQGEGSTSFQVGSMGGLKRLGSSAGFWMELVNTLRMVEPSANSSSVACRESGSGVRKTEMRGIRRRAEGVAGCRMM
jgi:hypothetical protein